MVAKKRGKICTFTQYQNKILFSVLILRDYLLCACVNTSRNAILRQKNLQNLSFFFIHSLSIRISLSHIRRAY